MKLEPSSKKKNASIGGGSLGGLGCSKDIVESTRSGAKQGKTVLLKGRFVKRELGTVLDSQNESLGPPPLSRPRMS